MVLVLDEIQKIDGWSDVVKGLWDADRAAGCPLQVVVVGSAPLLMQAGLNESLAGRFEPVRFTHWSYLEMSEAFGFSLDQYIYFGGYPGAAWLADDQQRWSVYVQGALAAPIIERDVLSMTRVDKPSLLKRLFDMGCLYSGQVLSYSKMVGQLQDAGNTTTLTRYLKLLGDAGLLTGLSKYTTRPVSAKASTPKLNVLNTALMSTGWGYSFGEARADRSFWGRLAESAVGAHLLNTAAPGTAVKYWRQGNHEVDFVLQRGPRVVGIEVKTGKWPASPSGLREFERRFRPLGTLVVGSEGEPLHEFLSVPADHWFAEELIKLDRHRTAATSFENDWRREVEQRREEERKKERKQRQEWVQLLRSHQEELLNNVFPPPNLQTLAMVYFGRFDDHDQMSPYERVNEFVGGDTRLTDAVMTALRGALWREDVPQMGDIVSLYSQSRRPHLGYPVQASMHILHEGTEPPGLPQDTQMRRGLAMYYCFPAGPRRCVAAWFREKPNLVLDVLHRCAVAAMRNGAESLPGVDELDLFTGHDDLVSKARLRLLGAFPTRTPRRQIRQFDQLLRKALSSSHKAPLQDLADQRLALETLNVPLRVRWMLVSALLSGGSHTQRLKEYVMAGERRVRHLAEYLSDHGRDSVLRGCQDSGLLADLVRMLGPSYGPRDPDGLVTVEVGASEFIGDTIGWLSAMADGNTHDQLASLVDDPRLAR